MQLISTTIILAPVWFVKDCLDDPEFSFSWLKDLQSVENFSGVAGEVGSQNLVTYNRSGKPQKIIQKLMKSEDKNTFKIRSKDQSTSSHSTYKLTDLGGYTKLQVMVEITSNNPLSRLLLLFTKAKIRSEIAIDFQRFKRLVEDKFSN
jgi:hypothetical protein